IFYTIDRWFVKYYMDVRSFAFYSFAISMMTVITVLIGALTTTLYPHLARNKKLIENNIKVYLLILGALLSTSYFGFAFIVEEFIVKYTESLSIISILFVSFPAIVVINALYSNLYKLKRRQKKYFFTIFCVLVINIVTNLLAIYIYTGIESIAIATSVSFYIWYVYSGKEFKDMKSSIRETMFFISLNSFPEYTYQI
ncbi:lipopolysaccharide biosynthesis protein, partial [Bacillus sp. HC-TM]